MTMIEESGKTMNKVGNDEHDEIMENNVIETDENDEES